MKNILMLGLALAGISAANAQTALAFKPFKVDIAMGAAIPQGAGAKTGFLFAIEPKYSIMDELAVGLRMEGAITARGFSDADGNSVSGDVAVNGSYLATGDYYFSKNGFRPFAGAGAGIFSLAKASVKNSTTASVEAGSKFGGMIRAGFEVAHFRLGLEYNLIGNSDQTVVSGSSTSTISSKNSYLGIKIGCFIGGGKL
jgi:outer membrane protein X